jgi:hypothetical protein
MKTFAKILFGAALLTGSALAVSAPASAQSYSHYGSSSYGSHYAGQNDDRNRGYDDHGRTHDRDDVRMDSHRGDNDRSFHGYRDNDHRHDRDRDHGGYDLRGYGTR